MNSESNKWEGPPSQTSNADQSGNQAEKKSFQAEKRERILEALDQKVGIVNNLWNYVEDPSIAEQKVEKMQEGFDQKKQEVFDQFDPETVSWAKDLIEFRSRETAIKGQFEQLYQEVRARLEAEGRAESSLPYRSSFVYGILDSDDGITLSELSEVEQKKWNELKSQSDDLVQESQEKTEKLNELKSATRNDIKFLIQVEGFFDSLIGKRETVLEQEDNYEHNKEQFQYFLSDLEKGLEDLNIERRVDESSTPAYPQIEFSGFHINVFLPSDQYEQLNIPVYSRGCHILQTPVNVLRSDLAEQQLEHTLQHEQNHNLSESFVTEPVYWEQVVSRLESIIDRYGKLTELQAPRSILENELGLINRELERYIEHNQTEVIANLHRSTDQVLDSYTSNLLQSVKAVEGLIDQVDNPEIKNAMADSLPRLVDQFINNYKTILRTFTVAGHVGLSDEVRSAMILLKVEKPQIIEKYIRHQVGEDSYDFFQKVLPFIYQQERPKKQLTPEEKLLLAIGDQQSCSGRIWAQLKDRLFVASDFFTVENIKAFSQQLDKADELAGLPEWERVLTVMKKTFTEIEFGNQIFYEHLVDTDVATLKAYRNSLEKVVKKLDLERQVLNDFDRDISFYFFERRLVESLTNDSFEELEQNIEHWPFTEERSDTLNIIADHMNYLMDTGDINIYKESYPDLKQSPLWQFAEKYGLTDLLIEE